MTLATLLATWFGSGLLKPAPGTWGSLVALPTGWLLAWLGGWPALLVATVIVFAVGVWASDVHCHAVGRDDASEVVIDEVAAQWLVLVFASLTVAHYLVAFVLFRAFDIAKPWPASLLDRKLKGGWGVMMDDVAAAFYAILVLVALVEGGLL